MWKRLFWLTCGLLLSTLLQATVIPALGGLLRQLDLILALTSTVALLLGPGEGALFGLLAGLLRDIVLGPSLGFYAIPLFVTGYGIGHFSRIVFRDSILVPFLAGLGSAAAYWLMLTVTNGFLFGYWLAGRSFWQLPIILIANSLLVPVIYALFSRYSKHLEAGKQGV